MSGCECKPGAKRERDSAKRQERLFSLSRACCSRQRHVSDSGCSSRSPGTSSPSSPALLYTVRRVLDLGRPAFPHFTAGVFPENQNRQTAFSTSSSNATLPTALRVSEENLGVPREINSFVLTVGATANQNGTALYEGVTVLFLAQLAGVNLSLGQQVVVAYMAILAGIGTAGVPSGSIPFVIVVLTTVGIDPSLIALNPRRGSHP